jgi:hypothetical protein
VGKANGLPSSRPNDSWKNLRTKRCKTVRSYSNNRQKLALGYVYSWEEVRSYRDRHTKQTGSDYYKFDWLGLRLSVTT